jgi:actin-related protein
MALTDYVTKDLHKQARQGGTRMAVQDSQGEDTFYPDDLLPKIQQILAIMADLELRYETDRYHLENWSGPKAIKAHVLANLEQSYKANRERYEVCLEELRSRTRAHIEGSHRIHQKLAPAASMQTKH